MVLQGTMVPVPPVGSWAPKIPSAVLAVPTAPYSADASSERTQPETTLGS